MLKNAEPKYNEFIFWNNLNTSKLYRDATFEKHTNVPNKQLHIYTVERFNNDHRIIFSNMKMCVKLDKTYIVRTRSLVYINE